MLIVENIAGVACSAHACACAHANKAGVEYFLERITRRAHVRIGEKSLLIAVYIVDQFVGQHVRRFRPNFLGTLGQSAHQHFLRGRPATLQEVVEWQFLEPGFKGTGNRTHARRFGFVVACISSFIVTGRGSGTGGIEQAGGNAAGYGRSGEAGNIL